MSVITDYRTAVSEIMKIISDAWSTTGNYIAFPGVKEVLPTGNVSWARVTLNHVLGEQVSIGSHSQIYKNQGIIIIQIFVPLGSGISSPAVSNLVKLMQNCFRAVQTPGGIFFKNVTVREIGISNSWYQVNVNASFVYNEQFN